MRNINKTTKELKELGFNTNNEIIEGLIFEYKDISPKQLKRAYGTIDELNRVISSNEERIMEINKNIELAKAKIKW